MYFETGHFFGPPLKSIRGRLQPVYPRIEPGTTKCPVFETEEPNQEPIIEYIQKPEINQ